MSRRPRSTEELRTEIEQVLRASSTPPITWSSVAAELDAAGEDSPLAGALEALASLVREQDRQLRLHRSQLAETNAGLLALRAEIERQRRRSAFLDDVSRAAATTLDSAEMLNQLVGLVTRHGFADRTRVWLVVDDELVRQDEGGGGLDHVTSRAFGSREAAFGEPGRVSIPLRLGPRVLGVLDLYRDSEEFDSEDVALAQGVANRAAVGLRNATAYEHEHELAQRLQRAMLPVLADQEGVDLAARYRSATRGVHVGGDWYDAVTRQDGTVVLMVGDVTGHGLDAAVVMGKLQNALRAYALEGHGPATSLRLVHELLRGWTSALYATAIVAEIDIATGVMRWSSAGHPPPVLLDGAGVRYLEVDHAPMLGISASSDIPQHEKKLEPGSIVALYTDGLVERRSSDIDTGMAKLADVLGEHAEGALPDVAEHILRAMLDSGDHDDDVCLLLCRWFGV
ncbi:serine/threonine protein phosphatase [Prauserella marina]|uniref:Serine phosphatase RsbU, regulator of sigma subunit n=1 Tax=Prauserella marina TaxID=530584 RepID=A0A222VVN7_9PSEU|nr:GAF domain-containing SpoIIE family protein phosphatase [Prauserella marina]ASR38016.1 serine/threonine protein phosphatase [Prauserella marina]PWV73249.1 serine phosphatase RsbU (regulator of sigma subunit) [Prauserella marina]SDD68214.1 Serine phosphatase RsbU, regulator of sigma subunit [Prauserella marina]